MPAEELETIGISVTTTGEPQSKAAGRIKVKKSAWVELELVNGEVP